MTKEDKKIIESLNELTKEQLIYLLSTFIKEDKLVKNEVIEFIGKNIKKFKAISEKDIAIAKYNQLWDEADTIISDFDEYGGGPEDKEEIATDNLEKISGLFKKGKLPDMLKKEFIECCIDYYGSGNSGFDDFLIDAVFDSCTKKDDWLFLVEKLRETGGDYSKDLIIRIYRERLNDDENYLKERMSDLRYGNDYYDLVKYYTKKGDIEKAKSVAKEGVEKAEGFITDLIDFLKGYYRNRKGYGETLKYMEMGFIESPSLKRYIEIKQFCKASDWAEVSKKIEERIKKDKCVSAEIDYYNKDYKAVFNKIKDDYWGFDSWAVKLEQHLPNELLEIYKKRITGNIEFKNVKNYRIAMNYCWRARHVLCHILHRKEDWLEYISRLKQKYPNLPALQRELKQIS